MHGALSSQLASIRGPCSPEGALQLSRNPGGRELFVVFLCQYYVNAYIPGSTQNARLNPKRGHVVGGLPVWVSSKPVSQTQGQPWLAIATGAAVSLEGVPLEEASECGTTVPCPAGHHTSTWNFMQDHRPLCHRAFFPLQSGWAVFDDAASGEYPGPAVFGPGPAARAARRGNTSQSRGAPKAFFCRGIKCDSPTCAVVMGILCMLLYGIPGIRMRLGVLTSLHLAWQK